MHYASLYAFRDFYREYFMSRKNEKLKFLDVGSLAVGKSGVFGRYLRHPNWEYVGLDIVEGRNVDVISKELYHYPFEDNSFDAVISGSTLEHVEDIYAVVKEMARITKDFVWIIVPNMCKQHRYPIDCWRIFPDGMKFLLKDIGGLKIIKAEISPHESRETIGIAKKIK